MDPLKPFLLVSLITLPPHVCPFHVDVISDIVSDVPQLQVKLLSSGCLLGIIPLLQSADPDTALNVALALANCSRNSKLNPSYHHPSISHPLSCCHC